MLLVNAGSGQRRFEGWVNLDVQSEPDRRPDVVADMFRMPFRYESVDVVVSHHTIEHLGCGEADGFIAESYRLLKVGGSLIVAVPNIAALATRYSCNLIDDFTFLVNMYGAYMGDESDRHRWGYNYDTLKETLEKQPWSSVKMFNHRHLEGALIARDWWITVMEAIK